MNEGFFSSEKSARHFTMEHCYKENEFLRDKNYVSRTNKALSTKLNDHRNIYLENRYNGGVATKNRIGRRKRGKFQIYVCYLLYILNLLK